MHVTKTVILTTLSIFLAGIAVFIGRTVQTPTCESPLILFGRSQENQPAAIITNLISELGGLPKTGVDVYEIQHTAVARAHTPIYPVQAWGIETSTTARMDPTLKTFLDDDPTYAHNIIVHVTYTDDDTATLQWSSWSYGIVACPLLISMGSGPPGEFQLVQ